MADIRSGGAPQHIQSREQRQALIEGSPQPMHHLLPPWKQARGPDRRPCAIAPNITSDLPNHPLDQEPKNSTLPSLATSTSREKREENHSPWLEGGQQADLTSEILEQCLVAVRYDHRARWRGSGAQDAPRRARGQGGKLQNTATNAGNYYLNLSTGRRLASATPRWHCRREAPWSGRGGEGGGRGKEDKVRLL
jgi:hypothetical protein